MGGNTTGVFGGGSIADADFGEGDEEAKFQWGKGGTALYTNPCFNAPKDTEVSSLPHITHVKVVPSKALEGTTGFIYTKCPLS